MLNDRQLIQVALYEYIAARTRPTVAAYVAKRYADQSADWQAHKIKEVMANVINADQLRDRVMTYQGDWIQLSGDVC